MVEVDGELVGSLADHGSGTGDASQVTVKCVGGFEGQHRAARSGERQQNRLQDLVRTVGDEHLAEITRVQFGDSGP